MSSMRAERDDHPGPSRSERDRRSSRSRSRSRDRDERRSSRRRSSRSRSRSRSRSDSRDRSRERRRRKKKSGWDAQPAPAPAPAAPAGFGAGFGGFPSLPDPAGAMPPQPQQPVASGSVHPSRLAQLGNLPGVVPAPVPASMPYNPMMQMQGAAPVLPPHLAALMNPAALAGLAGGLGAGLPQMGGGGGVPISAGPASTANLPGTRQARRLYVGGLPMPLTEPELKLFFDTAMKQAFPDLPAGDSVVSVYLNVEKKFGFVEFRNPEEATTGLGLDGIVMRGQTLRLKRPSDYNPQVHGMAPSASRIPAPSLGGGGGGGGGGGAPGAFSGQISSQVPDGPHKVFCGGIPYSLSEQEVQELLASFGQLRAFHLVKDRETGQSKGYCFFEYVDPSVTDTAVMGLNNLKISDKTLTVRRAQPKNEAPSMGGMGMGMGMGMAPVPSLANLGEMAAGLTPAQLAALAALRAQGPGGYAAAPPMAAPSFAPTNAAPMRPPTRVLVLNHMVVAEGLRDDTEYREICEDIDLECRRFGEVRAVVIPRPAPAGPGSAAHVPGLGRVFVEFAEVGQAVKARAEVEGRQFDGRTVAAEFMDEAKWARRELD